MLADEEVGKDQQAWARAGGWAERLKDEFQKRGFLGWQYGRYCKKPWYCKTNHVLNVSVCGSGLSGLQLVAVLRTSYDEQRIEVTAAGHLNPSWVTRCQACPGYCFSQTVTLLVA